MPPIEDRVAIVTGAAQGLGRAYAQRLADEGAVVVAVDEQPAVHDLEVALTLVADVGSLRQVRGAVSMIDAQLGGVDILVNNAARWKQTPVDTPRAQALADYRSIVDANTRGAFLLERATVASMIARGGGQIVNISTYYVLPPRPAGSTGTNPPDTDLYGASKWALNGFTQAWALALEEHGIRVNAIAMGATDTPMLRGLYHLRGTEPPPEVVAMWMTVDEHAQLLVDLLSEGPDGRTGETIGAWVGEPVALPPRRERGAPIT